MTLATTDALGQLERTQTLLERGPISLVAAGALIACVLLALALYREMRNHRREIQALHEQDAARLELIIVTSKQLSELIEPLRRIALEWQLRAERKRSGEGSGLHKALPRKTGTEGDNGQT
jgi:hypothetical protein